MHLPSTQGKSGTVFKHTYSIVALWRTFPWSVDPPELLSDQAVVLRWQVDCCSRIERKHRIGRVFVWLHTEPEDKRNEPAESTGWVQQSNLTRKR